MAGLDVGGILMRLIIVAITVTLLLASVVAKANELDGKALLCKNQYETEYSGNVNLKNIKRISNTKINRISVGSITHSSKSFDLSLEFFS